MTTALAIEKNEINTLPELHRIEYSNLPTYTENELSNLNREADNLEKWLFAQDNTILSEDVPLVHRFAPGVYIREIYMKAPTLLVGRRHTTEHFNIILKGKVMLKWDNKKEIVEGPCIFSSAAGIRKALVIMEDTIWQTVHANPTDETNISILEDMISQKTEAEVANDKKLLEGGSEL